MTRQIIGVSIPNSELLASWLHHETNVDPRAEASLEGVTPEALAKAEKDLGMDRRTLSAALARLKTQAAAHEDATAALEGVRTRSQKMRQTAGGHASQTRSTPTGDGLPPGWWNMTKSPMKMETVEIITRFTPELQPHLDKYQDAISAMYKDLATHREQIASINQQLSNDPSLKERGALEQQRSMVIDLLKTKTAMKTSLQRGKTIGETLLPINTETLEVLRKIDDVSRKLHGSSPLGWFKEGVEKARAGESEAGASVVVSDPEARKPLEKELVQLQSRLAVLEEAQQSLFQHAKGLGAIEARLEVGLGGSIPGALSAYGSSRVSFVLAGSEVGAPHAFKVGPVSVAVQLRGLARVALLGFGPRVMANTHWVQRNPDVPTDHAVGSDPSQTGFGWGGGNQIVGISKDKGLGRGINTSLSPIEPIFQQVLNAAGITTGIVPGVDLYERLALATVLIKLNPAIPVGIAVGAAVKHPNLPTEAVVQSLFKHGAGVANALGDLTERVGEATQPGRQWVADSTKPLRTAVDEAVAPVSKNTAKAAAHVKRGAEAATLKAGYHIGRTLYGSESSANKFD